MAIRDQGHQEAVDHVGLADDDLSHLQTNALQQVRLSRDLTPEFFADPAYGRAGGRRQLGRRRLFGWNGFAQIHGHVERSVLGHFLEKYHLQTSGSGTSRAAASGTEATATQSATHVPPRFFPSGRQARLYPSVAPARRSRGRSRVRQMPDI